MTDTAAAADIPADTGAAAEGAAAEAAPVAATPAAGGAATAALATQAAAAVAKPEAATDAEIAAGIAKTEADEKAKADAAKSWIDGLPDGELKDWAKNKNFADIPTMLEAYRKTEAFVGAKGILPPTGPEDKEGYARAYKALGLPDTPEGYKLQVPEGMDPAFTSEASKWFHESGLNPQQATGLVEKWSAYADAKIKADQDAWNANSKVEMNDLQAEWGPKAAANTELAQRAAAQFGIDTDKSNAIERALGTRGYMELLHKIGSGLVEHSFEVGDTKGFSTTAAGAQARITQLAGDKEWSKSYLSGDKTKLAEMERLQKIAYPGEAE